MHTFSMTISISAATEKTNSCKQKNGGKVEDSAGQNNVIRMSEETSIKKKKMQHTLLQNDLWPSEEVHDGT